MVGILFLFWRICICGVGIEASGQHRGHALIHGVLPRGRKDDISIFFYFSFFSFFFSLPFSTICSVLFFIYIPLNRGDIHAVYSR